MPTLLKKRNRNTKPLARRAVRRVAAAEGAPVSLDLKARTVRAFIATDEPVRIYDWEADEYVDEILIPSGMIEPKRMKLRVDHRAGYATDVIGRVSDFKFNRHEVEATLRFNRAADVENIWQRVVEGDLNSVSVGASYRMADCVRIDAGESTTIGGTKYTARADCPARIVTRWNPDETSVVDFPADARSVIRSAIQSGIRTAKSDRINLEANTTAKPFPSFQKGAEMPKRVNRTTKTAATGSGSVKAARRKDVAKSVRAGVQAIADGVDELDDSEGDDFDDETDATQTRRSRASANAADDSFDDADDLDGEDLDGDAGADARAERTLNRIERLLKQIDDNAADRTNRRAGSADDVATARMEERQRVSRIRELGAGQSEKLIARAIESGWTVEQFGLKLLERMQHQSQRTRTSQSGDGINRAPAAHIKRGASIEALQAGLLHRSGINLQNPAFATEAARVILNRNHCGWLYEMNRDIADRGNAETDRFAEDGRRYSADSAARTCERMLQLTDRNGAPDDVEEIVQRSFSNPVMPRVFGTIISVGLVEGYAQYADSTIGWTSEADWADFRQNQPIGLDPTQGLQIHTRGTKAKDVDFADYGEAYSVARYTGRFVLDDMDIIDDQVGANQMMPREMGFMAARLRPDLIYSVLQTNGNLADGVALFATARGNALTSNALSIAGLTAAEAALATRVTTSKSGRTYPLNLMAGFLIVPRGLRATGKSIVSSTNIVTGNTTPQGERNPHDGEYQLKSDARLDTGVNDPRNGNQTTGSATTFYIAERSGQQTLQVGYRRGTGRAPQIRVRPLAEPGVFGLGWDIAHDIGVGVINPRGLVRSVA